MIVYLISCDHAALVTVAADAEPRSKFITSRTILVICDRCQDLCGHRSGGSWPVECPPDTKGESESYRLYMPRRFDTYQVSIHCSPDLLRASFACTTSQSPINIQHSMPAMTDAHTIRQQQHATPTSLAGPSNVRLHSESSQRATWTDLSLSPTSTQGTDSDIEVTSSPTLAPDCLIVS